MSIYDELGPYFFPSKKGKHAGRNGLRGLFCRHSRLFSFGSYCDESTCPFLHLELACKQLCFPPRKRKRKTNESAMINAIVFVLINTSVSQLTFFD